MVLTSIRYNQILQYLIDINCSHGKLNRLKDMFKDDIGSQRTCDRIVSLFGLLRVLEKRDCLGPERIPNLISIIQDIAPYNQDIQYILYGQEENNVPHVQENVQQRVLPPVSTNVIDRINDKIRNDIGYKWKELARALGIQEGQIDNLSYKYTNLSDMAHEILTYHQEQTSNNFELWRSKLQQALTDARRRDLSEEIDEILTFHRV